MSNSQWLKESKELMESAGFVLSPEEKNYLSSVTNSSIGYASAVSSLYSAKLLERSNKLLAESNDRQAASNDKHANRMTWLTGALGFFALVEAAATVVTAGTALHDAGLYMPWYVGLALVGLALAGLACLELLVWLRRRDRLA